MIWVAQGAVQICAHLNAGLPTQNDLTQALPLPQSESELQEVSLPLGAWTQAKPPSAFVKQRQSARPAHARLAALLHVGPDVHTAELLTHGDVDRFVQVVPEGQHTLPLAHT
jgi:hypothetical protein